MSGICGWSLGYQSAGGGTSNLAACEGPVGARQGVEGAVIRRARWTRLRRDGIRLVRPVILGLDHTSDRKGAGCEHPYAEELPHESTFPETKAFEFHVAPATLRPGRPRTSKRRNRHIPCSFRLCLFYISRGCWCCNAPAATLLLRAASGRPLLCARSAERVPDGVVPLVTRELIAQTRARCRPHENHRSPRLRPGS